VSNNYRILESFRDPDGLVLDITERLDGKYLTFRIQKEYEKDGEVKTSSYLARRHIPAVRRLLREAEDRIGILEDRRSVHNAR
jgi:hypothetical protein